MIDPTRGMHETLDKAALVIIQLSIVIVQEETTKNEHGTTFNVNERNQST
jgi:hypothetical protein